MRIVELERRTRRGLGLRIIIETIDKETHSKLADRRATTTPEMTSIARNALDLSEAVVDAAVGGPMLVL